MEINSFVSGLLIVLLAGFLSGVVCKRAGISLLVGYLVVGAIIGEGGLGLVSQQQHELEYLARIGALLLLFSIGIEFSLEEILRLSRFFAVGGVTQMLLVSVPLTFVCYFLGMDWKPAILAALAAALSSTVLVFKALAEWGQTATPHGKRAIGILLFQDVALVPLMLLLPMLTGAGDGPTAASFIILGAKSILFVAGIVALRHAVGAWFVPLLGGLRSVELVVLFALTLLGGVCWGSFLIGLPPAVGALAAGMALGGNRLSKQIDTLVLPYRETFAAVFFVTIGTLLHPLTFFDEPVLLTVGLIGMLLLKAMAAGVALRLVGLPWKAAAGMGVGLAQLGEFSFLLIAEGVRQGIISDVDYNRMLFIALGTLIMTPELLRFGLRWTGGVKSHERDKSLQVSDPVRRAVIIGIGPIGRQLASRLELLGVEVCLVDLSPINLHEFAQQGFATIAGDARNSDVLRRAAVAHSRLVVISVPDDQIANQIVRSIREESTSVAILVRCRFLYNMSAARLAGANAVVSEEGEASAALLRLCEDAVHEARE